MRAPSEWQAIAPAVMTHPDDIAEAVVRVVNDESLAGCVMLCVGRSPSSRGPSSPDSQGAQGAPARLSPSRPRTWSHPLLYVRVHCVSTGPVSGARLKDRRPRKGYLPGPCVVAGARNTEIEQPDLRD